MKTRSFVYVLTLLLTLGLIAFSVHAESENLIDADPKPTNDVESVETESADEAPDTETVAEALKKIEQILNVLQGSFEDITQLIKMEGITNDEVTNKVNQIVNNLKNIEGVEITTSFEEKELDLSEILKNPNDLQDFEKKVKVISENDNLDENAKKQKIFELIENLELDSTIFPDITKFKDVESQTMEPTEFFNAARDILGVIGKANELHKQGDLDKDQLAEKMREMLKDLNVKPTVISDSDSDNISIVLSAGSCIHCTSNKGISDLLDNALNLDEDQLAEKLNLGSSSDKEVSTNRTQISSKNSEKTESVEELEQRVGNLEKKIDTLIEKLSK